MPRRMHGYGAVIVGLMVLAGVGHAGAQEPAAPRRDTVPVQAVRPPAPGCAVAATGSFGHIENAYGLADLERGVRITPATIFEAGSVSKQFTAAAVVLLAQQGKLSLDDDIRKYVPEVPQLRGKRITIRELLNHTSGLRDWGAIAGMQGWPRGSRAYTNSHVLDIVAHQRALNFSPGDEWMYSNTNYNLAAILVARVSGKSLAEFTRAEFFVPLGMTQTSWRDDYRRVVPGRALAYEPTGNGFRTAMPGEDAYGNDGLLTTVGDLLTWNAAELDSGRVGGRALVEELEREGTVNGGKPDGYGLGLFVGEYRGIREYSHTGATGGYRAYLARWPARHTSVAMLCNAGGGGPDEDGLRVALLGEMAEKATPPAASAGAPPAAPPPTPARLATLAGLYRQRGSMLPLPLEAVDGALRTPGGVEFQAVSATELRTVEGPASRLVFPDEVRRGHTRALRITGRDTTVLEPVAAFDTAGLYDYDGTWYSPEAEATWRIVVEENRVVAEMRPDTRLVLTPAYDDAFLGPGQSVWVFDRDRGTGLVKALGVWMPRARNIRFEKVGP